MYRHDWAEAGNAWFINVQPFVPGILLGLIPIILAFVLWSVVWKGLGLWHAARRGQPWWFLAILVINTFGILEIIYLFFVAKLKFNELFSRGSHETHEHHHHH